MLLLEIIIIIDKPFSYLCWLLSLNFIKCYKKWKEGIWKNNILSENDDNNHS